MHAYMHAYMRICVYICVYACIYAYMRACMRICVYACIYAYMRAQDEEPIQPEDADGHVLMVTGRIIWCSVCGRYQTSKRTCRLREQCPKQPENRSQYRLKRLQKARRPAIGEPLGEIAQRLTLARWSADVAISACKKGEEGMEPSHTSSWKDLHQTDFLVPTPSPAPFLFLFSLFVFSLISWSSMLQV